jgi:uncharacterized membrane protein YdbT with pleckstrin-like domain
MIVLNQELHLGTKAFVLFALEKMKWILVFIASTLLISIIDDAAGTPAMHSLTSFLVLASWLSTFFGVIWAWLLYKHFTFSFGDYNIKMRSGVLVKKEVSIPYRQVQSVDIIRTVQHQMLGLSKLVLLTGGHEEANEKHLSEVVLEPIEKKRAEEIRSFLEEKVGVQIVRPEKTLDKAVDGSSER